MAGQIEKIALFIDGANLYATAKSLGFDIDYKRLLREFQSRGYLVRAFYYTAVIEDQEYSSIRPLIDWLDYNGYTVVTKATKEFVDQTGRRKVKGNMDIELAVDAMELAPHIDQMVLFSGDGDFRSLVEAVQRRGVRVIVVSTISTQPPMVADELRRQADEFVDIINLQNKIGRDPGERPMREPREGREPRGEPRHTPQFLQRSTGAATQRVETEDEFDEDRTCAASIPAAGRIRMRTSYAENHGAHQRKARPRLSALPAPCRVSRDLARQRAGMVQCAGRLVRTADARLLIVGLAPGLRGANRTGRPFTGDYAGDLLYATLRQFGFAEGEYEARPDDGFDAGRLPHHQCGALRAAREQADAARDQDMPAVPRCHHRGNAEAAGHRRAGPRRPRNPHRGANGAAPRIPVPPRPRPRAGRASPCSTAITARATTRTPGC